MGLDPVSTYTWEVLWASATAWSGVLSPMRVLQRPPMLPDRGVSHPCRRPHRLAHGVPEGSKAISPIISKRSMRSLRPGSGPPSREGGYAG